MRQQGAAFGGAHCKTRQIVIAVLVEAGHLGSLAADQRAAGFAAAFGDTRHDGGGGFGVELAAGEVIQKEQWFRALNHEIVD